MLPNVYFDRLEKKRKMEQKEKNEEANEERKEAVCKPISFHPSVGRTLPSAAPQAPHLHTGAQREKNEPGGTAERERTLFPFGEGLPNFQSGLVHTCIISLLIREEGWFHIEEFKCNRLPAGEPIRDDRKMLKHVFPCV